MKKILLSNFWQTTTNEFLSYIVLAITPLLVVRGHIFPFIVAKSCFSLGIISLIIILYIWSKYRKIKFGHEIISITRLHLLLILFALVLGISAFLGINPRSSWFGTFQQGTGLVYIYGFIFFAVVIGSLVNRRPRFAIQLLTVTFISGACIGCMTFLSSNFIRESGGGATIGNTSFAGAYLVFIANIGVGLFLYYEKLWKKMLIGLGLLILLSSPLFLNEALLRGKVSFGDIMYNPMILIGSANGAAVGIVVSYILVIGLFATRSRRNLTKIIGVVICIFTIIGIIYIGQQLVTSGTALNQKFIAEKSASRFVYWDIAHKGFNERPLFGFGWGNYGVVYQKYFDPILFTSGHALEPSLLEPHNILWSYASTTGSVGLVAYLLLIGGVFVVLYRTSQSDDKKQKIFGIVLSSALVGYFIQNMFIFDTPTSYLLLFLVFGIAAGFAPVRWSVQLSERYRILYAITTVIIVLLCLLCFIFFAVLPWRESQVWFNRYLSNTAKVIESPQSISVVGNGNDTVYITSNLYTRLKPRAHSLQEKKMLENKIRLFISDLSYDANVEPNNYKIFLIKGILENGIISLIGESNRALIQSASVDLSRAIELNPHTPEPYFNLAQTDVYDHNFTDAYKNIQLGIEIAPMYGEGYGLAEMILKIAPDKEFENHIKSIKQL